MPLDGVPTQKVQGCINSVSDNDVYSFQVPWQ